MFEASMMGWSIRIVFGIVMLPCLHPRVRDRTPLIEHNRLLRKPPVKVEESTLPVSVMVAELSALTNPLSARPESKTPGIGASGWNVLSDPPTLLRVIEE